MSQPKERIFYRKHGVLITSKRAVFDTTTYVVRNISSVTADTSEKTTEKVFGILLLVSGIFFLALWVIAFISDPQYITALSLVCCPFAGISTAIGGTLLYTAKKTFHVSLVSSSGEIRVLSSHDEEFIDEVLDALDKALVERD